AALRLLRRLGLLLPRSVLLFRRSGRGGGGSGPLASASATAAAAALWLRRVGGFGAGRLGGRVGSLRSGVGLGPGFVRTWVVGRLLLPETEPGQVRTPSWKRAPATSGEVRARSLSVKRLGMAYDHQGSNRPRCVL